MHDYGYQQQRDGSFTVYSLKPHTGDKLDIIETDIESAEEAQEVVDDLRERQSAPWLKDDDITFTRSEARIALAGMNTHAFVDPKFALAICAAFELPPIHIEKVRANTGEFKGLETDGPANETAWGVSAWNLAEHVARGLGLVVERKMGRGSRTTAAVQAILTHAQQKGRQ